MTVKITFPVDALVSYHYYRDDKDMAPLAAAGRLRLIGDSGAFSALTQGARIDVGEYAAWVARWRQHLYWVANLDVIGDPAATFKNWLTLRDRYGLDTVSTLHAGTDAKWMDAYAAEGVDFLGLGGMAGRGQAQRAFRWAIHMFRHGRDRWPGMRFHLWGVTRRLFLDSLPTYSADSSGVITKACRYGALRLFDPATGRTADVSLHGRGVYGSASLLRRTYGVDPTEIETSHAGNRTALIELSAAATQQYASWLRRRHGEVEPPTWGLTKGLVSGPRLHMVSGPTDLIIFARQEGL